MGVFLNKVLPLPFLPIGVAILLGVWALAGRKRAPGVLALLVLWVGSMGATGDLLRSGLEATYPRLEPSECPRVDAIVVLGGYLRQANGATPELPEFSDGSERLLRGIDLLRAERAEFLVTTGARISWLGEKPLSEGEFAREVAIGFGVEPLRLLTTDAVQNTSDEARAVAEMMRERGWTRILLVTSAFHLPRAMEQFQRAGVDAVPFPCDWKVDPERPWTLIDFLPSAEALRDTELSLREWYGRLFYALRAVVARG